MAGRDSANGTPQSRNAKVRRRRVVILGGAAGAFMAAAAMATGSAVPARADIDALLDPIIQPLMTSLSDAIAGFDPAAATDLTSWTDSLLSSLNSIDLAVPSAAEPAAAAASSTPSNVDIPLTVNEVTEPAVTVSVNGGQALPMLVDTGSGGLVLPWYDVGLLNLAGLGSPVGSGISGYSGGVDYFYLTFDTTVDYPDASGGDLSTSNIPVDVELFSWPTSFSAGTPSSFDAFLQSDQVSGVLGIGDGVGPSSEGPLQEAGYSGVTVDIPQNELVLGSNAGTPIDTIGGAPIPNSDLTEVVTTPGGTPTSGSVSADIDSGGVYGTIPSSLVGTAGSLPDGTKIAVYDGTTLLYSYVTGTDTLGNTTAPAVVSGTSIDSGVEPYLEEPIYISYSGADGAITFDEPLT